MDPNRAAVVSSVMLLATIGCLGVATVRLATPMNAAVAATVAVSAVVTLLAFAAIVRWDVRSSGHRRHFPQFLVYLVVMAAFPLVRLAGRMTDLGAVTAGAVFLVATLGVILWRSGIRARQASEAADHRESYD